MKKVLAIIIAMALLASMAACAAPVASAGEAVLIGVSMPTRTAARWIVEGELMRDQLVAAGYRVDLQFANDQVPDQVSQIENMITRGAKFLIICPIDGASLSGPLATAKAQGIRVLAYDRLLMATMDVDYYVGFNSESIGNLMGRSLMKGIDADNAEDPLYIELFAGSLDDSNTPYYFFGAMNMIQPYIDSGKVVVKSKQTSLNEVAIPGWDGLRAQDRMQNLLSAHYTTDTLAGALSPYDGLSIGIIGALKAVGYGAPGRPMPVVTGQDCEPPSLISIWNDEQYSSIFLDLNVLGSRAVEVTKAMLENRPIDMTKYYSNGAKDVPAYLADAFELTKENIKEYFFDRGTYTENDLKLQ